MHNIIRLRPWLIGALVLAVPVVVAACGGSTDAGSPPPAVIEHTKGSKVESVRLTAEAARRIGIRTAAEQRLGSGRLEIPYDALLYDPTGRTWTYTNTSPLVFRRHDVSVVRIEGSSVLLRAGPAPGTRVVTQGATELWGVEYGGIKED